MSRGPVVAAAAVLPAEWAEVPLPKLYRRFPILREVRDSKLVPKARRAAVRDWLVEHLAYFAIGEATAAEIDRVNILNATYLAMSRAVEALGWESSEKATEGASPKSLLIDGNRAPRELCARYSVTTLIEADRHSLAVASASILAKVHRDTHLRELALLYPNHAFELHKGYGTGAHHTAIRLHGVTPEHRRSFAPVRAFLEGGVSAQPSLFDMRLFEVLPEESFEIEAMLEQEGLEEEEE